MADDKTKTSNILKPGESVSAPELMSMKFETSVTQLIAGFLSFGLVILASEPKKGKSWLTLLLALCLSTGKAFLGFPTEECGVQVLFLEDPLSRIQNRMQMLIEKGYEPSELFRISNTTNGLPEAICKELDGILSLHPEIKLVVIDTLQKVRNQKAEANYQNDYGELSILKRYADEHGITILVLHHTRKQEAGSSNARVSGTFGITAVADQTLLLERKEGSNEATLKSVSRDAEDFELHLKFENGLWRIENEEEAKTRVADSAPRSVKAVETFMRGCVTWEGTSSELANVLGLEDVSASTLSRQLEAYKEYLADKDILFERERTGKRRAIRLQKTS